jgi:CheY-like chemotaxis protein
MNADITEHAPLLLVADDHRLNRLLIERILESLGYRSVMVQNGQEAVDAVRTGQFDGVLLDLEMPVMGGLQAALAIRALGGAAEKLPLLALTAHSEAEFEHEARKHGFD